MTTSPSRGFIDLDRTFRDVPSHAQEHDDVDISEASRMFRVGAPTTWANLKSERRTVLLAEAGAGKTEEIRQAATGWRADGNQAFFLRLELVADDFETSFEVGDFDAFERWMNSPDEGWLLLDSVDEARLRAPTDFERAIRRLAKCVRGAEGRLHLLITSRASAWRPKTDLDFCTRLIPPPATGRRMIPDQVGELEVVSPGHAVASQGKDASPRYRIVTLDDLDRPRIGKFAEARGVVDLDRFLDAIERRDAWAYTRRPQDLAELVEFWRDHGLIGSRLELVRSNVARRLEERDQARAEWQLLTADRCRAAARRIAAACILVRDATIQVPDGSESGPGIHLGSLLLDWNARELNSFLARPLFDEAIYGTVRFHHREAREYLAAEWFADLLRRETSRTRVEALFFRRQYDLEVVTPSLRPVLPWLALLDDRIRTRLLRVAPQVLFEGGDPSQLPVEVRAATLRECCRGLAGATMPRTFTDYSAVQRFSTPDLAGVVRELLQLHADSEEATALLCRMIWIGPLPGLQPEARKLALRENASPYVRIVAVRTLKTIGASDALQEVRQKVLSEGRPLDRGLLAELVTATVLGVGDMEWFSEALRSADPPRRHAVDRFTEALQTLVGSASPTLLQALARAFGEFLTEEPLIDAVHSPVPRAWAWLVTAADMAFSRLALQRDAMVLEEPCLEVLRRIGLATKYLPDLDERKSTLEGAVRGWDLLNRHLFWHEVAAMRPFRLEKGMQPMTHFAEVWPSARLWAFGAADLDYLIDQVSGRPEPDDRAVALSIALVIFDSQDRPDAWKGRMIAATAEDEALQAQLRTFLDPLPESEDATKWRRQEKAWQLRNERATLREARRREGWREGLRGEVDLLRNSGFLDPPGVSRSQSYLLDRMREADGNSDHFTDGNWEDLVQEFGTEVAEAFRDGARAFWRNYDPLPRSEGAKANSTPVAHVFGLAGLAMEAREDARWASALSPDEATRATRYAVGELNGFPTWLPQLYAVHPEPVLGVMTREIEHQVRVETPDEVYSYVLSDVSWAGAWCWDGLGPCLVSLLAGTCPRHADSLANLLVIVHGSTVLDVVITDLARCGIAGAASVECLAVWFAALVGVDPGRGIPLLREHLDGLTDPTDRTLLAMHVVTRLTGGRTGEGVSPRRNFVVPGYLAELYVLMHEHIRRLDDIDRVGGGAYSPGLRDEAQEARDGILGLLDDIPGKATFVALSMIAETHPDGNMRPFLVQRAVRRAEADADLSRWDLTQVRDFGAALERTPRDHSELAELVLLRFLDLKADLEGGDESIAPVLRRVQEETEMRNFLARELRSRAQGRYHLAQEVELADGKRPDLRFDGNGFDAPVPAELKLADRWTGPELLERLENQLCGDYLRDARSRRGFFVLVHNGTEKKWELAKGTRVGFEGLVEALDARWKALAPSYLEIDDVQVIGINLPLRTGPRAGEKRGGASGG